MRYKVDLDEARRRIVPISEGAHRNRPANRRTHASTSTLTAACYDTDFRQKPVHRCRAHRHQFIAKLGVQLEPAMTLKGWQ
ncbi:hypothetical protein N2601_29935 (plasmid) [Rhizobium sp. CB3060]|uniref:hypothetical protein n=1 Tax=Rhizobium sp. CB3060 TaxID=3138255 RepID=UPI0021A5B285|nr:hypothetical protein [Rhizobium tropici]UWU25663.1 hypothetical protein N2601_29935 [Rhizobium tropici]